MFVVESGRASTAPTASALEFALPALTAVRLPTQWHTREAARCLAARVARKPGDLMSHMRRIWLHHDMGDADGVGAAAVDLFIATQDKGHDLRRRVLCAFAADLRRTGCYAPLREALDGALSCHDPRIERSGALLGRPIAGRFDFVRRAAATDNAMQADDPFDWSAADDGAERAA